jgi:hypothetical protein
MPVWAWILIAIGVVAVVGLAVWRGLAARRTHRLRSRFGPEYDRSVNAKDSKREAEAELAEREARHERFDLRPLPSSARSRYREEWSTVQAQFVDDPAGAVARADALIQAVMDDRGYPVEDFDQRSADVSVEHPEVVERYREGHRLYERTAAGNGSTEDLRNAMRNYRALFEELVDSAGDGTSGDGNAQPIAATASREPEA